MIFLNIVCGMTRAGDRKQIIFWKIRCEKGWCRGPKIGHLFILETVRDRGSMIDFGRAGGNPRGWWNALRMVERLALRGVVCSQRGQTHQKQTHQFEKNGAVLRRAVGVAPAWWPSARTQDT